MSVWQGLTMFFVGEILCWPLVFNLGEECVQCGKTHSLLLYLPVSMYTSFLIMVTVLWWIANFYQSIGDFICSVLFFLFLGFHFVKRKMVTKQALNVPWISVTPAAGFFCFFFGLPISFWDVYHHWKEEYNYRLSGGSILGCISNPTIYGG